MLAIRVRTDSWGGEAPRAARNALALIAILAIFVPIASTPLGGTSAEPQTLVGAGDIAGSHDRDEATAKLLDATPGTVFTTGDNAYSDGSTSEFAQYYDPTWGRHKARTRPSLGNHDWHTPGGAGYFGYFGSGVGEPGKGWYSYDLGAWHLIALNSNCGVGCDVNSEQYKWLEADLKASSARCTAAYWHHPLFTSPSNHGPASSVRPFWDLLYRYGADVVLNGHNHNYERFAQQTPAGVRDDTNGIRQFTVGTGGAGSYGFSGRHPNNQTQTTNHGVLKLTLYDTSYAWEFLSIPGSPAFTDTGTANCVGGNLAPAVSAGTDQVLASGATATLDGTVTDDGLPTGSTLTTTWTKVSGSGTVTFANASAVDTTATFGADDTYILRLSASDGEFTTTDDISIAVGITPSPTPTPTVPPPQTTLDRRVVTGNDDAEESSNGSVSLSSSDLELAVDGSTPQTIGIRFTNVTIPARTTVTAAWVQFKVDESSTGAAPLTIKAHLVADAPAFTTATRNVSSRALTGAGVSWSPPDWPTVGAAGTDQRTPDLSAVINEVLGTPGWASGSALAIVITGTGRRTAEAFNGDAAGAPLLHVEYGSGPTTSPSASPTLSATASPTVSPTLSPSTTPSSPGPSPTPTGIQTLQRRVATGNDDAEESATGAVDLGSSDLELVQESTTQTVGLRFTSVTIPRGATITSAWIQFKVDESSTGACSLTIQAEAADNASAFTTATRNVSARARTPAAITWIPPTWPTVGAAGSDQRTPNLAAVVGQVVGRSNWVSGNALVIVLTGSGKRVAESFNGDAPGAPLLHVEFSV